jgi:hypothetical protein
VDGKTEVDVGRVYVWRRRDGVALDDLRISKHKYPVRRHRPTLVKYFWDNAQSRLLGLRRSVKLEKVAWNVN